MTFKELRYLFIGDYTFVEVYDDADETEHILTAYNGRDNLVDDYNDCRVTGITACGHYGCSSAIRVEIAHEDVEKVQKRAKFNARDQIIWGEGYNAAQYLGGVRRFKGITLPQVKELIEKGYLNPEDQQNFSPTVAEMVDFVTVLDHSEDWLFEGYAVSPDRADCRVTLDGLYCNCPVDISYDDMVAFVNFARLADDFRFDYSMQDPSVNAFGAWWG